MKINLPKLLLRTVRSSPAVQLRKSQSTFKIHNLIRRETPDNYTVSVLECDRQHDTVSLAQRHYLSEHVLVKARSMSLLDDRAVEEYLLAVLKQGNTLCAKNENGDIVGLCVNHATSPVDPRNLRNFAFYRQNRDTKDFLYFTAKLQETPNLWEIFKQQKIFEIKMLLVLPEYRRQGLAALLAGRSRDLAKDLGYKVVRMDCINPYDYKIAECLMMRCMATFSLHRLRGPTLPFIRKNSKYNKRVRVYVDITGITDPSPNKMKGDDFDSMIE